MEENKIKNVSYITIIKLRIWGHTDRQENDRVLEQRSARKSYDIEIDHGTLGRNRMFLKPLPGTVNLELKSSMD